MNNTIYTYLFKQGTSNMATPIEIGLKLEGQDAIDFIKYMENPTYSEACKQAMRDAMKMKAGQKLE